MLQLFKHHFYLFFAFGIFLLLPYALSANFSMKNVDAFAHSGDTLNPEIVIYPSGFTVVMKPDTVKVFQMTVFNEGWNILPVLSTQSASTFFVFRDIEEIIDVVHEINGPNMYWPSQHIYTLTQLVPGKSYFIRVTQPCYVVYPSTEDIKNW